MNPAQDIGPDSWVPAGAPRTHGHRAVSIAAGRDAVILTVTLPAGETRQLVFDRAEAVWLATGLLSHVETLTADEADRLGPTVQRIRVESRRWVGDGWLEVAGLRCTCGWSADRWLRGGSWAAAASMFELTPVDDHIVDTPIELILFDRERSTEPVGEVIVECSQCQRRWVHDGACDVLVTAAAKEGWIDE